MITFPIAPKQVKLIPYAKDNGRFTKHFSEKLFVCRQLAQHYDSIPLTKKCKLWNQGTVNFAIGV